MPYRNREGENFEETGEVSCGRTAKAAHNAVTGGRGVAFLFIYSANRDRQLARSEKEIPNAPAEFTRRSVIIPRRILNVGNRACGKSDTNQRDE